MPCHSKRPSNFSSIYLVTVTVPGKERAAFPGTNPSPELGLGGNWLPYALNAACFWKWTLEYWECLSLKWEWWQFLCTLLFPGSCLQHTCSLVQILHSDTSVAAEAALSQMLFSGRNIVMNSEIMESEPFEAEVARSELNMERLLPWKEGMLKFFGSSWLCNRNNTSNMLIYLLTILKQSNINNDNAFLKKKKNVNFWSLQRCQTD